MYDLGGKNVLFVAYHYPPEAGAGLPGSMRTVKFVRNFSNANLAILTKNCNECPLNANFPLPVNGEKIYRSASKDFFSFMMKFRSGLKKLFRSGSGETDHQENGPNVFVTSVSGNVDPEQAGNLQGIKDFVHDLFYFPDQASPWIIPAFFDGLKIIRRGKTHVIFATGMPWSGLVVGWLLHLVSRKPLIVDFRDPWLGNPFHKSKGLFLDFCSKFLERRIVKGASLVTLNTDPLRREFVSRYHSIPEERFITLPNGYDLEDFNFLDDFTLANETGDDLVLCHAGFLYGLRDPAPILEAIRMVNAERTDNFPRVVFKQIGKVSLGYDIEKRFSDLIGNESFVILQERPYRECIIELAKSDILVNVQPGTKTQIPSKLYDYLALNLPILNLTPKDGALGKIVAENDFGKIFEGDDVDVLVGYLFEMLERKLSGPSGIEYPQRKYFDIREIAAVLGQKISKLS